MPTWCVQSGQGGPCARCLRGPLACGVASVWGPLGARIDRQDRRPCELSSSSMLTLLVTPVSLRLFYVNRVRFGMLKGASAGFYYLTPQRERTWCL